jgi:AcrR family transcriptional regulator
MSPRTAEQTQRVRDERREAIFRAARVVFGRKGLAAAKMADVAAAAGVSYGLVYHYFPGKEALFVALVQEAVDGALRVTGYAREREGTPWERLRWLCERMLAGVREEPEQLLLVVEAYTSEGVPAEARAILDDEGEQVLERLADLIREPQQAGQAAGGDPRELARAFFALVQGLGLIGLQGERRRRFFPQTDTVLRLLKAEAHPADEGGGDRGQATGRSARARRKTQADRQAER